MPKLAVTKGESKRQGLREDFGKFNSKGTDPIIYSYEGYDRNSYEVVVYLDGTKHYQQNGGWQVPRRQQWILKKIEEHFGLEE